MARAFDGLKVLDFGWIGVGPITARYFGDNGATVIRVEVSPGEQVQRGDTLVILEAMKMELPIRAAADGTVASVSCKPGDLVQPGMALIEIE